MKIKVHTALLISCLIIITNFIYSCSVIDTIANSYYDYSTNSYQERNEMNDYRKEVYQLMLTTNRCIGVYYEIAKEMGIKENTLLLLDILSDQKQHSQKQICDDWHIHKTTLNTIIKECIRAGYIILLPQKQSKEKLISLTENGQIFADKVTHKMKKAVQHAMEKIHKEFSTDFITVFEKYVECLECEYRQNEQ